jgi:hypothetical protein
VRTVNEIVKDSAVGTTSSIYAAFVKQQVSNCLRTLNLRRQNTPLMPGHTFPPRILSRSELKTFGTYQRSLDDLKERMNDDQKRANEIAQMKGAAQRPTSLPLKFENHLLNKREFHNAIRMRYR